MACVLSTLGSFRSTFVSEYVRLDSSGHVRRLSSTLELWAGQFQVVELPRRLFFFLIKSSHVNIREVKSFFRTNPFETLEN